MVVVEDPQAPEELARIHEQLWQTVLQFGNFSASQERNRIARDLHDSLGQALTALNIQLQTAVKLWQLDPARAEQFLVEAQRLGSTAVKEVRQTVKSLRTDVPEERSIETLLDSLVESFHRSTGIAPVISLKLLAPLPPEVVVPIYRIFQEGLNNICKYAQATEVQLQLMTASTSLGLMIQDNGRGFDLQQTERGFGLRGMQERVALLQGHFQVETEPGRGCRIRVVIPLRMSSIQNSEPIAPPGSPPPLLPLAPVNGPPPSSGHLSDLVEVNHAETVIETHRGAALLKSNRAEILIATHGAQTVLQGLPANGPVVRGSAASVIHESVNPGAEIQATETASPATGPTDSWGLSSSDCDRLTKILIDFIGPVAPALLQTAIAHAHTCHDLLDQLTSYLPPQQQQKFAQHARFLLEGTPEEETLSDKPAPDHPAPDHPVPLMQPESKFGSAVLPALEYRSPITTESLDRSNSSNPILDETAIAHCEQELTAIIGPIAHFLIQQTLTDTPDLSLEEFVERLVTNLPDCQKATQFKQQILPAR